MDKSLSDIGQETKEIGMHLYNYQNDNYLAKHLCFYFFPVEHTIYKSLHVWNKLLL
jgi:hypothetical protein